MITFQTHQDLFSQKLVFQEILKNNLHNAEGETGKRSRIENLAKGVRETRQGLSIMTAHKDKKIIGICICEHAEEKRIEAFTLKDPFKSRSQIKTREDWGYVPLGFFSVFVAEDHRKKGLAKTLLQKMENLRMDAVRSLFQHELDLSFF